MAELCLAAGADKTLIQRWIGIGRQRAATTAAAIPYTGLPQTDNSIRSSRSDSSRTRWASRSAAALAHS
jgi:hypothetical protein